MKRRLPPYWERVIRTDNGCLLFAGALNSDGYGVVKIAPRIVDYFHRLMWQRANGPIPAGKVIEHDCHSRDLTCPGGKSCLHRACGDVAHMRLVTQEKNKELGVAHRRAREEQAA